MKKNKINLSTGNLITTNVIIILCLFYYSCENTITKSSDILDCNDVLNGSASVDDCGLCTGGTTNFEFNELMDCEGECGGSALEDCAGVCNGLAVLDECDMCGGDNSTCTDCVGIINGFAFTDNCGDCVGGTTGIDACPFDCAGIEGGTSWIDACGECVVEGDLSCIQGCDGNWSNDGSELLYNDCGVCDGDNSTCIVINEINYNSSDDFNPEDWVELYNSSESPINIGNWKFRDEANDHVFIIPENTILSANDFIVLCKDAVAFETLFPGVNNFIGDLGFGLGGGSDMVRLFDSNEILIDEVEYDDDDPWPVEADGGGYTLELIHPSLDNSLAENWLASMVLYGSPAEGNGDE